MTYTRLVFPVPNSAGEGVRLTARQAVQLDTAAFEQDARITTLEAQVADLLARVTVLEGP